MRKNVGSGPRSLVDQHVGVPADYFLLVDLLYASVVEVKPLLHYE